MYIYIHTYIYTHTYIYVCTHTYVCMCVYTHIYIYVCMYSECVYIYMYIDMYMTSVYSAYAEQTNGFSTSRFGSQVDLMETSSNIWLCIDGPRDVVPTREMDHGEIPGARPHLHAETYPCVDPCGNE
jgi:hypothetical protein